MELKNLLKYFFILLYTIFISYLITYEIISIFNIIIISLLIPFLIIIDLLPKKHNNLFYFISNDDLNGFIKYLKKYNLTPKNIHKLKYITSKTPIIYAMERNSFKIFEYLVKNGYNLNYYPNLSEPPITFASHSAKTQFMELLLKYKNNFDLYAINTNFNANAIEIALWRERKEIIELLLRAGMNFSIKHYSETKLGKELLPFKDISIGTKKNLLKYVIFKKKENYLNLLKECNENPNNNKLKIFNLKSFFWEDFIIST